MLVIRHRCLIDDGMASHKDYWNKVANVYVSALALNCLCMHMRVYCLKIPMWCSLLLLVLITVINVCAVHTICCAGVYKHSRF